MGHAVRAEILFPPSTERCVAQSFGGERTLQLDITILFCGHLVLFCLDLLSWQAVRDFYLPNRLRLLLSNLPLQQNDKT